jgi:glycosyltransferase involved in cell wall biosynthesis
MTKQNSATAEQSKQPLVSVIMNCYNGEKYLKEAVDSVLLQAYQNWGIIFWDNQSTDRSAEIFKSYSNPRLKYFYAPKHTRLYEARNYAIEKSSGDFFAFLDVDDWWVPSKLEKQIVLFSDPEVGLVCGNHWVVNEGKSKRRRLHKHPAPTGRVLGDLLTNYFVGMLTLVVRRSALESLDYACDSRFNVIGDFDLVVRLAIYWKLDCVNEPIAFCRRHGSNVSSIYRNLQVEELETWVNEMQQVEVVRFSGGWLFFNNNLILLKAINNLLVGNKVEGFKLFLDLPWNKQKVRLLLILLLPTFVVRRLKN